MDPELLEEIGGKPKGSPEAREMREKYLDRIAEQAKGDQVGRIKVRMKERHILDGKGVVIPKDKTFMIPEEAFETMNKSCGGKLVRVGEENPKARKSDDDNTAMKPEATLKKDK